MLASFVAFESESDLVDPSSDGDESLLSKI